MSSLQEVFDMALVQLALWGKESLSTHKPAMNFMIKKKKQNPLTKLNMSIVSWFNESREGKEVVLGKWDFCTWKQNGNVKPNSAAYGPKWSLQAKALQIKRIILRSQ